MMARDGLLEGFSAAAFGVEAQNGGNGAGFITPNNLEQLDILD